MSKPRVYIETTIPSAYYTDRRDARMVNDRLVTRAWWQRAIDSCELVTSRAVLNELARGKSRHVPWRLAMLNGLRLLEADDQVRETASVYIRRKAMPANPVGDALHLAIASHHKCDLLVTWNYRHLANPSKLEHMWRINQELGLFLPRIATPLDLLEDVR
jgi:predicted nucleic acid-binding protein